jgi:hypothetical protein
MRFRASGYQAAADEIMHIRESASEVRTSRRRLTIPVVVVTGGRGADAKWRQLQRDQASLSERGCLIIAHNSGHVVSIDQPKVVVDAIRVVVETARGHEVPFAAHTLREVDGDLTSAKSALSKRPAPNAVPRFTGSIAVVRREQV